MSGKREAVLDPEIAAVLAMLKGAPPMDTMEIGALRASMIPMPVAARPPVGDIEDIALPGGLTARTYQPVVRQCDSLISHADFV